MQPCNQCGKCCIKYSDCGLGSASHDDMNRWEKHYPNVLEYVSLRDMWVSPITHDEMPRCPWLRKLPNREKYKCRIHHVRPDTCNAYPIDIEQMIRDGCEMLEEGDLTKPREILEKELEILRNHCETNPWQK